MRGRIRDSSLTYCVINYIIIIYLYNNYYFCLRRPPITHTPTTIYIT